MLSGVINRADNRLYSENEAAEVKLQISEASFFLNPSKAVDSFFYKETSESVIIVEARLDNRQELVRQFKLDHRFNNLDNDAELTIILYQQLGKNCVEKLLGKFLIIDYQIQKRQLRIIMDQCDASGLYYYITDQVFIFASTLSKLLSNPLVPVNLNFDKIIDREAIIINNSGTDSNPTFYKDIHTLDPAYMLEVDSNHFKKERYWVPEQIEINQSIKLKDAAEQMRALFFDAVAARIQASGEIASFMSGGLDSGSVANVAATLLAKQAKTLHTYSHIPLYDLSQFNIPKNRTGNERPYIEASLVNHTNIDAHFIDSADISILNAMRKAHKIYLAPLHAVCNAFWTTDIYRQVQAQGYSVLLDGKMGNGTISFQGYLPALPISKLSLKQAGKKLLRPIYHQLKSLNKPVLKWQDYSYLTTHFVNQINLDKRILESGRPVDFSARRMRSHREMMLNLLRIGRGAGITDIIQYYGFTIRDPTKDRRLIEFMLTLPNNCFVNGKGENKLLIKEAMKGILPDKVLFQKGKGLQSADAMMRVQSDIPEIESIIRNFKTDFYDGELYDKARMLHDLSLLKELKLNTYQTHHLLRSVGIMDFLNTYPRLIN